ncbi:hypothetical protein JX265_000523 [Neoarthrinium moseri]|uniref:Aminoglycoside phosphotransferase domain-containing protein n=1 Tax=Neoarthrinium moseri TaxID=1658444 RepID=A0A9P9WZ03_9PEZI|nr:hypothetical protein JX265_000523 [Neoarthrinium moseri]
MDMQSLAEPLNEVHEEVDEAPPSDDNKNALDAHRNHDREDKSVPGGTVPKLNGLSKAAESEVYDWFAGDPYVPCAGCSRTPFQAHFYDKYRSNHKLFYVCQDIGAWSLGSKVIMKDRPFEADNIEADNMRFFKLNTTIPVPTVFHDWKEEDGRYILLQEKIEGLPLQEVWNDLTLEDHERIAKQAARHIFELRSVTSDKLQNAKGAGCRNNGLVPKSTGLVGPSASDDEL